MGEQQRLLVPTDSEGVTAAYAEQAHKVTLNASSDIFARCSKLQTSDLSQLSVFAGRALSRLTARCKARGFPPPAASTAGPNTNGPREMGSFSLPCQMLEAFSLSKR